MTNVLGVDVSNYQQFFDWTAYKGKIGFGAAKASEGILLPTGTYWEDPYFSYNWNAMKDLGIYRFAYHFAHANENPQGQAQFFFNLVRDYGLDKGDNFFLDLEAAYGMTPSQVSSWARQFMREMESLTKGHHRILIYTFPYFAQSGYCAGLENWFLWIANFETNYPNVPDPWSQWAFWQYQDNPSPDRDEFHGDEKQLKEFCTTSGKSPVIF
jgi:lysozyme